MKKIALFAAAMMLCAGMAFAQEPVKKSNDNKAKTECQQNVKSDKACSQTAAPKQHCGNCPHHAKANAQTAEQGCNKDAKKGCNKDAKGNCKKEESKPAVKK